MKKKKQKKNNNYNLFYIGLISGVSLIVFIGILLAGLILSNDNAYFARIRVAIKKKVQIVYNYNLFDANNDSLKEYNKDTKTLVIDGNLNSDNNVWGSLDNISFKKGDRYRVTINYISGSYMNNPQFVFELQKDNEYYTDRKNGTHYIIGTLPTKGITYDRVITIKEDTKDANGFNYRIYEDNEVAFKNYKIQILITKLESKIGVAGEKYGKLPTPEKDGYEFLGWYDSISGGKKITETNTILKKYNHPLYAHWKVAGLSEDLDCIGEYEGGYGLAKLNVTLKKGSAKNYKFLLDGKTVQNGSSSTYIADSIFTLLIKPTVVVTDSNGKNMTASCTVKHAKFLQYSEKGYYFRVGSAKDKTSTVDNPYTSNRMPYYVHVPNNIKDGEKLPLMIGLHGGYGFGVRCGKLDDPGNKTPYSEGNQTNHYFKNVYYSDRKDKFSFNNGKDDDLRAMLITVSNNRCSWDVDMYAVVEIMYAMVKLYNIDFDRIILTGVSQGGAGTLYLGFLEEQILYKATDNNTSLDSLATKYNTTVDKIIQLNKDASKTIQYANASQKLLKKDSITIIRAKNNNEQRSLFSILVPFSPGQTLYRLVLVNAGGTGIPPYTLKAPIWVITSDDEYVPVQDFAKELVKYYDQAGDIRYTVLHGLSSPYNHHDTDSAFFDRTSIAKWLISQTYGKIKVKNNNEIADIEKQMGNNFVKVWTP